MTSPTQSFQQRLKGLYLLTDHDLLGNRLLSAVEQGLAGGARLIQYRDKTQDHKRRQHEAQELRILCTRFDSLLIINDDIELAQAVNADGVHLGRDDSAPAHVRALLGFSRIIGVSCYNSVARAMAAAQAGADYIAFGSFYTSQVKPSAVQASIDLIPNARAQMALPIAAIGGIHSDNAKLLIDAGADMIAVVHGVFAQPSIQRAAQKLVSLFEECSK